MNAEFSQRPFVAGSLIGVRSFAIDSIARLTGISQRQVWTPGENLAECRRAAAMAGGLFGMGGMLTPVVDPSGHYTLQYTATPASETTKKSPKKHRAGTLECECGFWAYFDNGHNPYHARRLGLYGLIEGYGLITVGTRGFRAEKATIKALIVKPGRAEDVTVQRVQRNYGTVPVFASKEEAFEAFPLVAPPVPSPDDDPNFWTRSAS